MILPSLNDLESQMRQIQQKINALTGHLTARDDMPLPQESRLRVHLQYAEHAVTQAWSILHVAAKDASKRQPKLDPDGIGAAREACDRG